MSRTSRGKATRAALDSGPITPVAGVLSAVLADLDALEPIEVAQHIAPLGPEPRRAAPFVQLLAEDQGKKGAEHVARMAASDA